MFLKTAAFASVIATVTLASDTPQKRFEYRWSFKGPQLTQTNGAVPFWQQYGHAIPSEDQVRITPSLRSRSGSLWSKYETTFESWEAEIWLRISGKSRIGADGMALWFTKDPGYGKFWNNKGREKKATNCPKMTLFWCFFAFFDL